MERNPSMPMDFRLRHTSEDVPFDVPDFSKSVFNQFQERVVGRTQKIIENKQKPDPNPRARKSWSSYQTIEAWKALYDETPEWKGLSPWEIQKEVDSGGYAFYGAFQRWLRKIHPNDPVARKKAVDEFFPRIRIDRSGLSDIESWKALFDSHSEWRGLSTGEIKNAEGGDAFYQSFAKWCKTAAWSDETERRRLVEILFPSIRYSWKSFVTLEDWQKYSVAKTEWQNECGANPWDNSELQSFRMAFSNWCSDQACGDDNVRLQLYESVFSPRRPVWKEFSTIGEWKGYWKTRPEWHGMEGEALRLDVGGAGGFYQAFKLWCKAEAAGDDKYRMELIETLFPVRKRRWAQFVTLEDWVGHFEARSEWHGLSTKEIQLDRNGGHGFYQAFSKWCRIESAGDEGKRRALLRAVFPPRGKTRWIFEDWSEVEFDSHPERTVALVLRGLGMVDWFQEGKNLHVRTNWPKLHSIDFKIGDVFLEYHPVSATEMSRGETFRTAALRKRVNVTDGQFDGRANLYVFDELDTLFGIIRDDPELRFYVRHPAFWAHFLKEDWNALVTSVRAKVIEFDTLQRIGRSREVKRHE